MSSTYLWRYFNILNSGPFTITTTNDIAPTGDMGNGIIDNNSIALLESPITETSQIIFNTSPILSSIINNGENISFPTITTTLIGNSTSDILTNKIIDSITNTVTADKLRSASGVISILTATAPTSGQALMAISSTQAIWQTITAGAGGAITDVQYNNGGIISGTNKLTIDISDFYPIVGDYSGLGLSEPSSGIKLCSDFKIGRRMMMQSTPIGRKYAFQPLLATGKIAYWIAIGNGTGVSLLGMNNTTFGTATTRNLATTNNLTSRRRVGYVTTATAGTSAGTRNNALQYWIGNANGFGGFYYVVRFGTATFVSGCRSFVGMYGTAAAIGNVQPSSLVNILGFGYDTTDTQWVFMHNNSTGTAIKEVLTGTFNTNNTTNVFEAKISVLSNTTTVYYSFEVLNGGSYFEGSVSTEIPLNTQLLSPQIWINNGANASAVGIDVISQYIETDY